MTANKSVAEYPNQNSLSSMEIEKNLQESNVIKQRDM